MWVRRAILPLALCACQSAAYAEFKPFITLGAEVVYDDNSTRSPKKNADTERILNAAVGGADSRPWITYSANYNAARRDFADDTFEARTTVNGNGELRLHNQEKTINWVVENSEITTLVDVLEADTLDNSQQRSRFSTGPEINFRLGARNAVALSARKVKLDLDESGVDSERNSAQLSFQRRISSKTALSLSARVEDVEFENFANIQAGENDYERKMYSLGFVRQLKNGQLDVSAGESRIRPEVDEGREIRTPHYSVQLNLNQFGGQTTLNANRVLTDRSANADGGFRNLVEDPNNTELLRDFGSVDASLITRSGVSVFHGRGLLGTQNLLRFGVAWNESEQEDFSQSDSALEFLAEYSYYLTSSSFLYFTASYREFERTISGEVQQDKGRRFSFGFETKLSRKMSLNCGYRYRERDEATGANHDSNIVGCRLDYHVLQ